MGTCIGVQGGGGGGGGEKSQQINDILKEKKKDLENRVTLMIIGTGDSGKTTFLKQMKILHMGGLDVKERNKCVVLIRENVVINFLSAVNRAEDILKKENLWGLCQNALTKEELDDELADIISKCWENDSFRNFVTNTLAFQSFASSPLLFENAKSIASENFVPEDKFVLHSRTKTTGVQELEFHYRGSLIQLVDVGGQRSERRKWLSCFDKATAIIFLAAMDEYDLQLDEDYSTNRLDESLLLFKTLSGSEFLRNKKFILLLNKQDIFMKKVALIPLSDHLQGISEADGRDYKAATRFLQALYEKAFQQGSEALTVIQSVATDSENCRKVFNSIADYLEKEGFKESGLI